MVLFNVLDHCDVPYSQKSNEPMGHVTCYGADVARFGSAKCFKMQNKLKKIKEIRNQRKKQSKLLLQARK